MINRSKNEETDHHVVDPFDSQTQNILFKPFNQG